MTGTSAPAEGRSPLGTGLLLGAIVFSLAFVGNLPFPFGELLVLGGVGGSVLWRARAGRPNGLGPLLPCLGAMAVLTVTAPPTTTSEALAGAAGVAFLLWVFADPSREPGVSRRALPTAALSGLAVGLALSISLLGARLPVEVGVAGGLLAFGLLLFAFLLARLPPLPGVPRRDPPARLPGR